MSVSGQVSISSSIGTNLVFTVTGTNTLAYATTFQNILIGATTVDTTVLTGTSTVTGTAPGLDTGPNAGPYTLPFTEVTGSGAFTLAGAPGAITFVDDSSVGGGASITGSGAGDYVLFTGISPAASYTDVGGGNTVIFTEGNNLYDATSTGTGNDIIVTGTGYDTVNTGTGDDTVFSGTGHSSITLNDTAGGTFSTLASGFNDKVYLDDGTNTVTALGVADAIFATAPGQTIIGGPNTAAADIVTILQPSTGTIAGAGDSIYGGAASIAVFDSVGGNTLFGDSGTGQAYFVAGPGLTDTINSGGGQIYAFGSDGDSINFSGSIGVNLISGFAAGLGNETLNGSGASGPGVLALFGATPVDSVDASSINETLIGGSGLNGFVTGEGNETLIGGSGGNAFYVALNANAANITIQDFGASDNNAVTFVGYSADDVATAEANGTVGGSASAPSYTIQLSDGTTVQFLGVTSLTGHTF